MNYEEFSKKLDIKVKSFDCWFMNNTKWREVFRLIAETGVEIKITTVWGDNASALQKIVSPELHEDYVGDGCIIGGPLFYKEIRELRVSRFEKLRDPNTGEFLKDDSKSEILIHSLEKLGRLPISKDNDEIILVAYK